MDSWLLESDGPLNFVSWGTRLFHVIPVPQFSIGYMKRNVWTGTFSIPNTEQELIVFLNTRKRRSIKFGFIGC